MNRYLIATIKSWNIANCQKLKERFPHDEFMVISKADELTLSFLNSYKPKYVFFPHWSWIIPEEIYNNFNCVVFHSTDLPFGRGGSPIQNLLVRGIYHTKISAIKVCSGVDVGPVYMKEPIDISEGCVDEILKNISDIIFDKMIPVFLESNVTPIEQKGSIVLFKRRRPEQSEIPEGLNQRQIYDYIRMLDGEGYPKAFSRYGRGKIYYTDASFENEIVTAKVQFIEDVGRE